MIPPMRARPTRGPMTAPAIQALLSDPSDSGSELGEVDADDVGFAGVDLGEDEGVEEGVSGHVVSIPVGRSAITMAIPDDVSGCTR